MLEINLLRDKSFKDTPEKIVTYVLSVGVDVSTFLTE